MFVKSVFTMIEFHRRVSIPFRISSIQSVLLLAFTITINKRVLGVHCISIGCFRRPWTLLRYLHYCECVRASNKKQNNSSGFYYTVRAILCVAPESSNNF